MKIKVLKLGTICEDLATGLVGSLTHLIVEMDQSVNYQFQPRALNEEGQPTKKLCVCKERLRVKNEDFEEIEVPFEILGTIVTDIASGFTGMAVAFIRHINGCFHVYIQPASLIPGKNTTVSPHDFDLRGCEGEMIPALTPEEKKEGEERNPSPTGDKFSLDRFSPR